MDNRERGSHESGFLEIYRIGSYKGLAHLESLFSKMHLRIVSQPEAYHSESGSIDFE